MPVYSQLWLAVSQCTTHGGMARLSWPG